MLHLNRNSMLLLAMMLCAMPALAAEPAGSKQRYDDCLGLAAYNPASALGIANGWVKIKGGSPAEHCAAVALVALKRYAEAGARLDALGRAPDVGNLRASLFDQAGNAWLLAGDARRASASFQSALALSGGDADLYADLARAQALQKDWRGVEASLTAALTIASRRPDLLVLRASARHAQGNRTGARADVQAALVIRPDYPEALLERGVLAREAGDLAAARKDFESVARFGAVGAAGESARRYLATLDQPAPKPAPPARPAPRR